MSQDTYRGELNEPDTLHLYAYCKNDPINYVDPSGHDAIVLKSNFVSEKVGHMAVLVQNNKKWYYFSWAGEGYKMPQMGKKADPKSVKGKRYINILMKILKEERVVQNIENIFILKEISLKHIVI